MFKTRFSDGAGSDNSVPQTRERFVVWLLIACAIVLGIFFRVTNVDQKVFWKDEVITQFATAPRVPKLEIGQLLTQEQFLRVAALDRSASVLDVAKILYDTAAEQTPLYYMVARVWCQIWGEGPYVLRMLSVVLGLAFIGTAYFFGQEVFQSRLAGGLSAALVALSPFHLGYSQQARPYEAWALALALAGIAYLRASRMPSWKNGCFRCRFNCC